MGSSQSREEEEEDDQEEEEDRPVEVEERRRAPRSQASKEKVLEQEPEILPCHPSASPLSPQLSNASTPRHFGPSVKVWDPCNVLGPPPLLLSRTIYPAEALTEVFVISHGECAAGVRQDLVGGRWVDAAGLTMNGERQARALAVFLNSQGVNFSAVYASPLDRARVTAALVCRELGFVEEQIQQSDALIEMSQGQWEGYLRSEIYTPETISFMERTQSDFRPPSGESLRQVAFRMIEFLNHTVLQPSERWTSGELLMQQNDAKGYSRHSFTTSVQDRDGPHWDLIARLNRPSLPRKKSGKSRLQFMTTGDSNEIEDDLSRSETGHSTTNPIASSIGIFTHSTPIQCLIAGLLDCSPASFHRFCIDDSSITVLQHSLRTGWQIKRLNDTAHLRLL